MQQGRVGQGKAQEGWGKVGQGRAGRPLISRDKEPVTIRKRGFN